MKRYTLLLILTVMFAGLIVNAQKNVEFDKAIEMYTNYRNTLTPFELTEQGYVIKKRIEECENGKELVRNPVRVFIGKRDLYMVTFLGPEKPMLHKSDFDLLAFEVKPVRETQLEDKVEIKEFAMVSFRGKIMDIISYSPLGVIVEIYSNENHQMIASFTEEGRAMNRRTEFKVISK